MKVFCLDTQNLFNYSVYLPEEQQDQHSKGEHNERNAVADGVDQLYSGKVRLLCLKAKQEKGDFGVSIKAFFKIISKFI